MLNLNQDRDIKTLDFNQNIKDDEVGNINLPKKTQSHVERLNNSVNNNIKHIQI